MSIDPKTLPDGTVVEFGAPGGNRATGYIHSGGIWEHDGTRDWGDEMLGSGADYGMVVTRTFSPDPAPDHEVPHEEWANIKPGSRVRVEYPGDRGFFRSATRVEGDWHDLDGALGVASHCRVYLLDEPADPDADLIEAMAKAIYLDEFPDLDWRALSPDGAMATEARRRARAALAAVRAVVPARVQSWLDGIPEAKS